MVKVEDKTTIHFYKKLIHETLVNGVMWNPFKSTILATGSRDSFVRIYNISQKDTPIKIFKGHRSSVFHLVWHPHFDHILASGSDDKSIHVWDTKTVS